MLAFLISLALSGSLSGLQLAIYFVYLLFILRLAKLPVFALLRTSLLVFPFVGLFALMIYLSADSRRAILILAKSYLSALAVLVCVATTSLPQLGGAARALYVPAFLVQVTQLIYRYLFVLSGEVETMRIAWAARGGHAGIRAFKAASGMIAVLFGRAFRKAAAVHSAMVSRGFSGLLIETRKTPLRSRDLIALLAGVLPLCAAHLV